MQILLSSAFIVSLAACATQVPLFPTDLDFEIKINEHIARPDLPGDLMSLGPQGKIGFVTLRLDPDDAHQVLEFLNSNHDRWHMHSSSLGSVYESAVWNPGVAFQITNWDRRPWPSFRYQGWTEHSPEECTIFAYLRIEGQPRTLSQNFNFATCKQINQVIDAAYARRPPPHRSSYHREGPN